MDKMRIIDDMDITRTVIGIEHLGVQATKQDCFRFMDCYLEAGGNCIDTARLYNGGETDKVLGEWLREKGVRNKVVLCTKGSHNDPVTGEVRLSPRNIVEDLDGALRDLGIEHTDIHLLHRDNIKLPVEEIMPVLDGIVRSGKARAVGVSNWTASRIARANQFAKDNGLAPLSLSQIQYSLAVTTPAATGDLTHIVMNDVEYGWYRETQFPVMAYSAQARGYFIKLCRGEPIKRRSVLEYYDYFPENHRRAERIIKVAEQLNCSVSEICVAYVLHSGLNSAALVTVSSLKQMESTFNAITLTPAQIHFLDTGREG